MFFFQHQNNDLIFKSRSIEHAYIAILNNDIASAEAVFKSIDSPRANWGVSLVQIFNGFLERFPTYFEIRNFLEIDLDFLIKNDKIDYVESVLGALKILSEINQETYKYIARVMYENRFYKASKEYLEKSKSIMYHDPEMHFMFAKYYLNDRDYRNASHYVNECLKILPDYYPAKQLKKEISKYWSL